MGQEIDRSGGRALAKNRDQSLVGRRSSPQRLSRIIKFIAEVPVVADVCRRAACSRSGLEYWLAKSKNGRPGDGFDLPVVNGDPGQTERFHILFEHAIKDGIDRVEKAAYEIATGYLEPLTHQGRVIYKLDPRLTSLGFVGQEAYLLDELTGQPVPETTFVRDPEMVRWIMERRRPDQYGRHDKVDVNHSGGVLVVAGKLPSKELDEKYGGKQAVVDVEFEEIADAPEQVDGE